MRDAKIYDRHELLPIDWEKIDSGEILTKFVAVDKGTEDFTAEVHGFFDQSGVFYITNTIVKAREPEQEGKGWSHGSRGGANGDPS